ncbi:MAG TPA: protein kinase, partial [candidate division Zixibacteria bacterium]|nr:protein kinase [candidate division Zixibacteria bacterium]
IHRDLKPQNILVDSEGRVRIIDFGVARAVDADLKQTELQTRVGQIIGTAHYMSPEQFDADPNDLDTRSDVYALGVVLYELLSGRLPYDIASSGIFEIARIVRDERPTPLSALDVNLKGELETITLKALHKDREFRYQSAFGLAEDIRRYLKGEAISARPTSFTYQVRVFARRNKAVVVIATLAVALLIAGVITSTSLYFNMKEERARAAREAERAVAASEFLKNTLRAAVAKGYGDVRTVGDVCDLVSVELDNAFADDPESEADIRNTIGSIYDNLHRWGDAERNFRRALDLNMKILGPLHEKSIQTAAELKSIYNVLHNTSKELEMARYVYDAMSQLHGPADRLTLDARGSVADLLAESGEADAAVAERLEILKIAGEQFGENSEDAIYHRATLGQKLVESGDYESGLREAEVAYRAAVEHLGAHANMSEYTRSVYAEALLANGAIDRSKELYGHQKALDPLGIELEFQGSTGSLKDGIKFLVFFETWCPYSQRLVPKIVRYDRQYGSYDIDFLGLTRVTRTASDAGVRQFIADNEIKFPVLKENGRAWNYFECPGTPTTVALHDGEVIWKRTGSDAIPERIFEELLAKK